MPDKEERRRQVEVGCGKSWMLLMFVPKFSNERRVIWRSNRAPLIKQVEDAQLFIIYEFQHCHVVRVRNALELMRKSLFLEQLSLVLEDLGEIDLMKSLVGVIYE